MLLALAACSGGKGDSAAGKAGPAPDPSFLADNAIWRNERKQDLLKPDGWTSLVGLHWLELKAHYVGSSAGSGIRLAVGPPKLGMVEQRDGHIYLTPESGVALTLDGEPMTGKGRVELKTDHDPAPSQIGFDDGKGLLSVIKRGQRFGLRIKYADAPTRLQFTGLDYWPADPGWRIVGKFVPHPPGKTMPIVDIIGTSTDAPNPGAVEFVREGKTYRIEAMGEPGNQLFLVFADRTSGHGSYPAGRFIDTPGPDAQGKVVLDFNRAYSPPCAFTTFATCPLPPPENRLDLAITAGEKTYASHPATL
ncbi:DUF1684 domain-containing protein [Pseudoxanthomonas sp. CF125]|uniref:DUF1684 domain-containing protein n=1 Tax=Pseudoxanthomonas sp. CF125 TaxID=1855303 RepID=UPI000B880434|nr:DUF1684 domain-containing protein [Pseudoxanthomonas sp. CF125]